MPRDKGPKVDPRKAAEMQAGATMSGLDHLRRRIAEIRGNNEEASQPSRPMPDPIERQANMEFEKNFVPSISGLSATREEEPVMREQLPQDVTPSEDLKRSLDSLKSSYIREQMKRMR